MYLYKLTAMLLGAICGPHVGYAQQQPDYFACEKEEVYWKLMAGSTAENPIMIRFEQPERLLNKDKQQKKSLELLKGRLECRMRISLNKSKVQSLRIYWSGEESQMNLMQRSSLRKAFRKMAIHISGQPPVHLKYCRTTWVCSLDNGQLKKI